MERHVCLENAKSWSPAPRLAARKCTRCLRSFGPRRKVQQMLQAHYGERLSLSSLERYKRRHWQAQRELVQEMSAAQAAFQEIAGEARFGLR